MKCFKSPFFICVMACSTSLMAQTELPNFELGVGGGLAKEESIFNLDLAINIPISQAFSAQVNLDSEYVFSDPDYDDYAMSELNGIGFYRFDSGRLGAGLGTLEKKARKEGSYPTERTVVSHVLASYYLDDFTFDSRYAAYDSDFDRETSLRLGGIWYPSDDRRIGVYQERFDGENSWRIKVDVKPEKYKQKIALGLVLRDGHGHMFPFVGLTARYYFDQVISFKQHDRNYH